MSVSTQSKAALVLLMMGEELAGDIFKRLDTDDIRLLSRGMQELPHMEDDVRDAILEEFYDLCIKGDPLLFMESLPYYETRAYVNIVMRNYWMYQIQGKGSADCLTGMAQGLWPTFPTSKGMKLVRMNKVDSRGSMGGGSD